MPAPPSSCCSPATRSTNDNGAQTSAHPAPAPAQSVTPKRPNETDNSATKAARQQEFAELSEDPRRLIPELCRHFYKLGWASGTGGGLSIRHRGKIYCAPSGVHKERIRPDEMFVLAEDGTVLERPNNAALRCSECLALFRVAFELRNAGCCIHSHSINANLITALHSDQTRPRWAPPIGSSSDSADHSSQKSDTTNNSRPADKRARWQCEFRVSHQEMIKGIKQGSTGECLKYTDTLTVPIIDNVLYERDLVDTMRGAVLRYPNTNAVLVRNHGVYVWGETWQQAKSMAECYDYLFRLRLEAHKCGIGLAPAPPESSGAVAANDEANS